MDLPEFRDSETAESITIGESSYELSSLIYIAENQGFFAENGLNVTFQHDETGLASINRLLNDEVDIALTSEYAVVGTAFKKENISVIGSIDKFETIFLVGRKDRGIINVSDLKVKRLALPEVRFKNFILADSSISMA